MSIASELQRLQQAKADIIEAIEAQGVTVPEGSTLDELAELIDEIEGGGGGFPYPDPPVTDMTAYFAYTRPATRDLRNVITKDVTTIQNLFASQINMTSVNVSNWDTGSLENATRAFINCSRLTEIDLSSWDTGNLVTTTNMFYGCSTLTALYAKDTASADKFLSSSGFPSGVDIYIGPKGSATYYTTST